MMSLWGAVCPPARRANPPSVFHNIYIKVDKYINESRYIYINHRFYWGLIAAPKPLLPPFIMFIAMPSYERIGI